MYVCNIQSYTPHTTNLIIFSFVNLLHCFLLITCMVSVLAFLQCIINIAMGTFV